MTDESARGQALAAAQALDEPDDEEAADPDDADTEADHGDRDQQDGERVEADHGDRDADPDAEGERLSEDADEPEGGPRSFAKRWFRNDRELDLEDTKAIWDPWGRGGLNRMAAAAKQAGGWQNFAPAFWFAVGISEATYKAMVLKGMIPGKTPPSEGEQ